ncbi:MAG: endonuclease/exonuclease/phosphatase family protein [Glutamicibacter sp.]|uniref:endonuclease/exonuclease/phosphatase family protein n=1 Tax=Glutamicibacter sp. TaxID=1931995 RepID=UPI002FC6060F
MFPSTGAFAAPTGPGDSAGASAAQLSETSLRVATIQANLSGETPQELPANLMRGSDRQAAQVADKISSANADVVVLTDMDATQDAVDALNDQYLNNPDDARADVEYGYSYLAVGSKGLQSGADLNADGVIGGAEDAWGQAAFAEQGSIVVLSKYPIAQDQVTSVSQLKWQDVANDMMHHTDFSGVLAASIPVMSTGLWDIPIQYRGEPVHILATQTQPDAQDQEFAKARQADELKVLTGYLAGEDYVRTDEGEQAEGVGEDRYVIAGALGLQENAADRVEPFLQGLKRANALNDSGSYLVPSATWQVLGQGRIQEHPPSSSQPLPGTVPDLVKASSPLIWTDVQF